MMIVIDSREQRPFPFTRYAEAQTTTGTLATGDYSLAGLEHVLAVERKSIDDLIQCLSTSRERFERELSRARALHSFMVVVECNWHDITTGNYRSRMTATSASNSILALQSRWRTPFFFAGNREQAEAATFNFMRHYLENAERSLKNLVKNHRAKEETTSLLALGPCIPTPPEPPRPCYP